MKFLLLIGSLLMSIGVASAADLKVGDKCTTSSNTAGTVVVKYTEKGEAVGLKCQENTAAIISRNPARSADTLAKRIFDRWGKKEKDCKAAGGVWAGTGGTGSCTRPGQK